MYRKHLEKMEEEKANEKFITKVSVLPLVNSTMGQVTSLYGKTKDYNRFMKYTLEFGESVATTAVAAAMPVVNKFEPQLNVVNQYACQQLEKLEEKYPVINKPTEEIVEESKRVYEERMKPTIDRVVAVKNNGVDTVYGVKQYGVDTVYGMKQYGVDTVSGVTAYTYDKVDSVKKTTENAVSGVTSYARCRLLDATNKGQEAVNLLLHTQYGMSVAQQAGGLLDVTEGYVEKYLPEGDDTTVMKVGRSKSNEFSVARVCSLSNKVRQRMYSRAMKDFQGIQKRSLDTVENLTHTVNLIEYAKTHIDNVTTRLSETTSTAKDKMTDIWEKINKDEDDEDEDVEEGEVVEQTLEHKTIQTARYLTLKLKRSLATASTSVKDLPESVQSRMIEARSYVEEVYKVFSGASSYKELSDQLLKDAHQRLNTVQDSLNGMMDYVLASWPMTLVVPSRKVVELEMEEME